MPARYPIRTVRPEELDAWLRMVADTWGQDYTDERLAGARANVGPDLHRMLGAFDGDDPVGAAGLYGRIMTAPGGVPVPVAGVNWVGVAPTHRRRGLLTALIRRQLTGLHETGGEPIAALCASEGAIYGRFGFGVASFHVRGMVDSRIGAFAPGAGRGEGQVRLRPADRARPALQAVYRAVQPTATGWSERSERFWDARLEDLVSERGGATALRCALYEDEAYALYRLQPGTSESGASVHVEELVATSVPAFAAIWRYLLDIDLHPWVEYLAALDDPLPHLLVDARAVYATVHDQLHVRLVDVGRALSARRYAAPLDVVLEVRDRFCPWNDRRWRLEADGPHVRCEPASAPPDLALTSTELGAAYLGGTTLRTLAAAGHITEARTGCLERASAAFRGGREPFDPSGSAFPSF